MQFNIIFRTIFEYIHKKFRFMHIKSFCKYRKKLLASPRVHLVLYIELLLRCPDNSYMSVVCGNNFGTRLHDIYYAECFEIRPKYQHRGYACLKEVWFRNSNYKLQIYAIYDYLQIVLCSRFSLIY